MPVAMEGGVISPTITGDHQNRITDYTAIVVVNDSDTEKVLGRKDSENGDSTDH